LTCKQKTPIFISKDLKLPVGGSKSSIIEIESNYASDEKRIAGLIYRYASQNV